MTTRLRVILVALAVVAGVMLWPATANAATFSGRVSGTGGQGLFVRPGPSRGSGAPMYTLAEGAGVSFDCYVRGEVIAGYWYTGNIWHHLTSGGWVTDTYIYTGYDGPVPGEPVCGGTPAPPPPPPPPAPSYGYTISACGVADIRFESNRSQVTIYFNKSKAWEITRTSYSCLADVVINRNQYGSVSKWRTWIRNEIRNHTYAYAMNVMRSNAYPANLDFKAYERGCSSGACWQWYFDYYRAGLPITYFARGF